VRALGQVLVAVPLLVVVLWTLLRVLGVDLGHPWPALLTVYPWMVALGVVLLAGAVALRWWPVVGVAGLVVLTGAAVLAPRVVASPQPEVAAGTRLVVAVANLRVGEADAAAVVEHVTDHEVDVLVTLELTDDAVRRLTAAGLDEVLPASVLEPSRLSSGGGIHSRLPLVALAAGGDRHVGRTPRGSVEVAGVGPVVVQGVHPLPPIDSSWTPRWHAALAALPAPGEEPRILAGDFNATHDHPSFRALLAAGWVDAAAAVGAGLRPTFSALRYGEPVPPVTLDHVLVGDGVAVEEVAVLAVPDSDHRMVVATLRLPTT
jgi:endonuclease/exonuclease/phosphatase family metal-dependent hydrolase